MKNHTRRGALLAAVVGLMLTAGVALAHVPTITLDAIGNLGPYAPTEFPVAFDVTGQVCHQNPGGNLDALTDFKLFVNGVQEGVTSDFTYADPNAGCGAFSLPWSITGPGTYTVMVTVRHGNDVASDDESGIEVTQATIVVTECPAAPSIAVHYMMDQGVKPGSGAWKKVVKAVAGQTGSKGSLWAANACEAWYPGAVIAFVNATL